MFTGMEMMACQKLAVPAEIMHHIIDVESGFNPYAIGVVGGQLVRQPKNLGEALATVQMLDAKGYNFSVGLTQVNRVNLGKYGLDSYEKAFDTCPNLSVGARILAECYASSGGDWGKSFSCYYSGNFVTGYRDGYVQKIYASMGQGTKVNSTAAIPLQMTVGQSTTYPTSSGVAVAIPSAPDSAAYRVAIRSVVLDTATSLATAPLIKALTPAIAPPPEGAAIQQPSTPATTAIATAVPPSALTSDVFEPQVHGPEDQVQSPASNTATASSPQMAASAISPKAVDQADLRQGSSDNAFVF